MCNDFSCGMWKRDPRSVFPVSECRRCEEHWTLVRVRKIRGMWDESALVTPFVYNWVSDMLCYENIPICIRVYWNTSRGSLLEKHGLNRALILPLPCICVASNTYLRMFKEETSSSSKVEDHMSREMWWTQRHSLECVNVRTPKYFSQACRIQNRISVPYRICCAIVKLYLPEPKRKS